ncbi:hypothetical protein OGH69_00785 [Flavobacterium sp. MFBS3-15]|uniref:hypothetical protein n=1 Tax=Flavobacterium sp. MFBS3-15 TaxID=2989816 RepID=UPI00223589AD|nr:hypothetical protein [Flavobacterium sp. MFBS3-15]MCW4467489.1 hypothetical protein [Flavobacterium sp. MFBS3-15]
MKQITVLLLLLSNMLAAQNFEKAYRGMWAESIWKYYFFKDGKFSMATEGHVGEIDVQGSYSKEDDTLYVRIETTSRLKFYLDIDGKLIDTKLLYEYSEIPVPDTVTGLCTVKRKIQRVVISDSHGIARETLSYYGPDDSDPHKIRKQLYYFFRYAKLLPGAAEKIYPASHLKTHKTPKVEYDKADRVQSYSFFQDRGQNVVLQRMYQFNYAEETGYKFTSITDMPWRFETIKYTFKYDINDNLDKIIETGEDGAIIRTFKFF